MPEPPGNGVYSPAAGTALAPPPGSTPLDGVRSLGEMVGYVIFVGTDVKGFVVIIVTSRSSAGAERISGRARLNHLRTDAFNRQNQTTGISEVTP